MNFIEVKNDTRSWKIDYMFTIPLPEDESSDEGVFDKAKSIFKSFKSDTKTLMNKLVDKDLEMCKLAKIAKDDSDMN